MIDESTKDLLRQHRSAALGRFRWPWQADPNEFLDEIDSLAESLCSGNSLAAANLSDDLYNAHLALTTNADTGFDGVQADLQGWTGSAEVGFRTYMSQVKTAIGRYDDVLHDFRKIQAAYADLLDGIIRDVQNLVVKATDAQNQQSTQGGWTVALTALAGVAQLLVSEGWSLLANGVAAVASTGSATISTDGPGETAQSLRDALSDLLSDVINQRENFYYGVQQLDEVVSEYGNKDVATVEPPLPGFITAPSFDPATFHLPTDIEPPGVQDGVSTDPLTEPDSKPNSQITTRLSGD